jgi:hypothetical protein
MKLVQRGNTVPINRFLGHHSGVWIDPGRFGSEFAQLKHYYYLSKTFRDFDIDQTPVRGDCRGRKYLLLLAAITVNLARKSLNVMLITPSVTWQHGGETAEQTVPLQIIGAGGFPDGSGTVSDHGC